MGADDYIAKPFQPAELAARIRRCCVATSAQAAPWSDHTSSLVIDPVNMTVTRPDGRVVSLTPPDEDACLPRAPSWPGS
jgi:DNA-binding response OmpR family regulator